MIDPLLSGSKEFQQKNNKMTSPGEQEHGFGTFPTEAGKGEGREEGKGRKTGGGKARPWLTHMWRTTKEQKRRCLERLIG